MRGLPSVIPHTGTNPMCRACTGLNPQQATQEQCREPAAACDSWVLMPTSQVKLVREEPSEGPGLNPQRTCEPETLVAFSWNQPMQPTIPCCQQTDHTALSAFDPTLSSFTSCSGRRTRRELRTKCKAQNLEELSSLDPHTPKREPNCKPQGAIQKGPGAATWAGSSRCDPSHQY